MLSTRWMILGPMPGSNNDFIPYIFHKLMHFLFTFISSANWCKRFPVNVKSSLCSGCRDSYFWVLRFLFFVLFWSKLFILICFKQAPVVSFNIRCFVSVFLKYFFDVFLVLAKLKSWRYQMRNYNQNLRERKNIKK